MTEVLSGGAPHQAPATLPEGVRAGLLHEGFEHQARRTPERTALTFDGGALGYGELDRRANQLAHRLIELGAGPETRVALLLDRSPDMIVAILGVLKAGAAYLPLEPAEPARRLELMLEDAGPAILVGHSRVTAGLPSLPCPVVQLDRDWSGIARHEPGPPPALATPGNLAYVMFTSGSTGRPKAVMTEHRSIRNRLDWFCSAHLGGDDEVFVLKTPYTFDVSVPEIFCPLVTGGRLAIARPGGHRDGAYLVRLIQDSGATTIHFVPSMLAAFLDQPNVERCHTLRRVLSSGEALPRAVQDRFLDRLGEPLGCELLNLYGPTEAAVEVTAWTCRREAEAAGVPIGHAIPGARASVLGPELDPVPAGEAGELHLGGVQVARGYLNRPALTAERFVPDPAQPGGRMYRTGDLTRQRPDGALDFIGRIDGQVKVRGFRIELGEIESGLMAHAALREAAVVASPGPDGDARLVAHVAAVAGRRAPGQPELAAFLADRLPAHMVPAQTVVHDALPRTASGKVDRRALAGTLPAVVAAGSQPATATEAAVREIWEEVLGLDGLGVDRPFVELGGHSLHAARIVARLTSRLGARLDVRDLFEASTVAALGARLDLAGGAGRTSAVEAGHPLRHRPSFSQERLWFVDRVSPGVAAGNLALGFRVRGALDVDPVRRAWQEVTRRHEALRTRFAVLDGEPRVEVEPPSPSLQLVDAGGVADAGSLLAAEAARPFDLEAGPLARARLFRLDAEDHVLAITAHHAVADGWSLDVMARELSVLAAAYAAGRPSPLPEPALQFPDYAAWQRERLSGERLGELAAHWAERLAGAPVALELPLDHARPSVQTHPGQRHDLVVPPELARRVERFGQARGVTVFATLLAAFRLLLCRLSGGDDVLVGTPVGNRDLLEAEGAVGLFVNLVALRTPLTAGETFSDLAAREHATVLDALAHQSMPFEKLVTEHQRERDLSRGPVVQVLFNMYNFEEPRLELPGCGVEALPEATPGSLFDLTLYVRARGEGLGLSVVSNPDLFDGARMSELLRQYAHLVEQAMARPDRPLDEISLVTPSAAEMLPDPRVRIQPRRGPTVAARFLEHALAAPDRLAVADERVSLTYADLAAAADRVAAALRAAGLTGGGVVAVLGRRSAWLVAALLGALRAGGAFLVLDPDYPAARLAACLDQADVLAWLDVAPGSASAELEAHVASMRLLARLSVPALDTAPAVPSGRLAPGAGDGLAYVAFTSGTTGLPKGVVGTHAPLAHFLDWQQSTLGTGPGDRFAMLGGLSHDPLLRDVFAPLWAGAELHVPDPDVHRTPSRLLRWLREREVTVVHLTPLLGRLLHQAAAEQLGGSAALPALRLACFGGDELTWADAGAFAGLAPAARLVNLYGTTETPQGVGWFAIPRSVPGGPPRVVPVGHGVGDGQLLVLDGGRMAGIGELGEICVRTPHLAAGYLGDARLTAARFVPNPWGGGDRVYRTGDLGRHRPDGTVEHAGRRDRQVKVRGFRVELGDVEAALRAHPLLADAAVIADAGAAGEGRLVAYVVPGEGRPEVPELRAHLQRRLPEHLLPAAYVSLDRLPVTPNGKLDRSRLPRADDRPGRPDQPVTLPRDRVEETIAQVWRDVLRLPVVGVDDNFFDLGGNSLAMIRVQSSLERRLERQLSVVDLFRYPRIAALAAFIDHEGAQGPHLEGARLRAAARLGARRRRWSSSTPEGGR